MDFCRYKIKMKEINDNKMEESWTTLKARDISYVDNQRKCCKERTQLIKETKP